jgi:hypothetical protein
MKMKKPARAPKYQRPEFLLKQVEQPAYKRWLSRTAARHAKRDRKRNPGRQITIEGYKREIHKAVERSREKDAYTGEKLNWKLTSKFDNEKAKRGGRTYKAKFALLPTVDHTYERANATDFAICGWRTNDAKGDLKIDEFVELCRRVIRHCARKKA